MQFVSIWLCRMAEYTNRMQTNRSRSSARWEHDYMFLVMLCLWNKHTVLFLLFYGGYMVSSWWYDGFSASVVTLTDMGMLFVLFLQITLTSQWVPWRLESPATRLFFQTILYANIKENIKSCVAGPLWGESTGDWWIPSSNKGPVARKAFICDEVMTKCTS